MTKVIYHYGNLDRVTEKAVPKHVAIIMDGNGRWARNNGAKDRTYGHERGAANISKIVSAAKGIGIGYITFYTFSTENWARPQPEVEFILSDLLVRYLERDLPFMNEQDVRFGAIGDIKRLPVEARRALERVKKATAGHKAIKATLALNYGGRREILDAVKALMDMAKTDPKVAEQLTEESFRRYLYDPDLPDPDLLIRTGGDMRVSNFFLWQMSYTEFYSTDVLWPDFGPEHLKLAISEYAKRQRRFGGL